MSGVGGQLHAVALPFLVLGAGLGARTLGTVLAACGVTRAGGIALGGPLTDRLGPRRVMLAADGLRAVLVALLARAGHPSLSVLVVVAVPLGAGQGAVGPGLGGLLVGRVGPGLALVGDARSFIGSTTCFSAGSWTWPCRPWGGGASTPGRPATA